MSMTETKMTKVVAPADLEEGYTFDATVDGSTFQVTVPPGGVKEGDEFEVPYPEAPLTKSAKDSPKGEFKVGLFSCFDIFCKGLFWMGFCCTPLVEAQIMTRLSLDWCGKKDTKEVAETTFNIVAISFIVFLIIGLWFIPVSIIWIIYQLIIGTRMRGSFRRNYDIPANYCTCCEGGMEDFCCVFFCSCCTACQLARHTHDEDEYPYQCCTNSGLSSGAPAIV